MIEVLIQHASHEKIENSAIRSFPIESSQIKNSVIRSLEIKRIENLSHLINVENLMDLKHRVQNKVIRNLSLKENQPEGR